MEDTEGIFVVTEERRKTWEIELDILEKFKSICKKYGLSYCAISGTLLGAARHQGFIPWDDDIDLFLNWDDYKVFMKVAPAECQYPYFFQSHHTEPQGEASACRIRRSDTTGCTKWEKENVSDPNYNRGIFIDIFPLFNVPNSSFMRKLQRMSIMFWWKCIRGHDALREKEANSGSQSKYDEYIKYFKIVRPFFSVEKLKDNYLSACAFCGFNKKKVKEVGSTSFRVHSPKLMWDKAYFQTMIELPFENTTITCPAEYDKILSIEYGDWKVPVMNGAMHEIEILDTNVSYNDYFNN